MSEKKTWDGGETHVLINDNPYYLKPLSSDEGFDGVEVTLHPRWKESELSGDEWRWSHRATAYRKGKEIARTGGFGLFAAVVNILPELKRLSRGFLGSDECAQPGCTNEPDVLLRLKKQYDPTAFYSNDRPNVARAFCQTHLHRGDCSMEDSDDNYERIALRVDGVWKDVTWPEETKDE